MSSVRKNFTYNIVYQILILILPLITAPYISRVIGAEGNGIYSYTYSIVQYFVLFAMLGLNNYGNRTIAKCKDNKEELSKEFSSIYVMQLITTTAMTILYIGYILFFDSKYITVAMLQIIYLVSTCFDINWFFFGLEKFKLTVTRNTIIKILATFSVFAFVKSKNDLVIYIIIMVLSALISQLALWPFLRKEVKFVKPKIKDVTKHIKPNAVLFIPVIAVSIYKIMDKIILGNMATIENVAYFEYAERIINIPISIITALGTVMLPRISNLMAKGEDEKVKFYIDKSIQFMLFISIAMCIGLIVIAPEFVPIFLGNEFIKSGNIVQLLAITIVFISWANVIRTQYLIPKERDKEYIISVALGAVVNLIINIVLIPRYQAIGSAIATICAEFVVMVYQILAVRNEIGIKKYLKYIIRFILSGIIMYFCITWIKMIINNEYILIFVQVLLGTLVYVALNYKFIGENIQYIPILSKLKKENAK